MRSIKKNKFVLFFSVFSFLSPIIRAQESNFTVFYATPNVCKFSGAQRVPLHKKDKLSVSDWIIVPKNATLILTCVNKQPFNVKPSDKLKVSSLTQYCSIGRPGVVAEFIGFVMDEWNGKQPKPENNPHNIGAYSRGGQQLHFNINADTINYFKGSVTVFWAEKNKLRLALYKDHGDEDPIKECIISGGHFKIDSLINGLSTAPSVYYWSLSDEKTVNAPRNYLRIWPGESYKHAVDSVLKQVIRMDPASTAFMSGFLMERAGFVTEAALYYREAARLEPGNKMYQTAKSRLL